MWINKIIRNAYYDWICIPKFRMICINKIICSTNFRFTLTHELAKSVIIMASIAIIIWIIHKCAAGLEEQLKKCFNLFYIRKNCEHFDCFQTQNINIIYEFKIRLILSIKRHTYTHTCHKWWFTITELVEWFYTKFISHIMAVMRSLLWIWLDFSVIFYPITLVIVQQHIIVEIFHLSSNVEIDFKMC